MEQLIKLNKNIKLYLEKTTFNNIEILLTDNKILNLEHLALKDKIDFEKNGGYCFEHNKLFYFNLLENDYSCRSYLGRVVYGKDIDAPKTHRFNIVKIQKEDYLVDVGFGPYTPSKAVPLNGEIIITENQNRFRVFKKNENCYFLQILKDESFMNLYQFDKQDYTEADFDLSNYYTNTHPDSKFTKSLIISKFKNDEVFFINNFILTKINRENRWENKINSVDELKIILDKEFDIKLTTEECKKLYSKNENF